MIDFAKPTPNGTDRKTLAVVVICGVPVAGSADYPCTEPPAHGPLGHGVEHRHDGAYSASLLDLTRLGTLISDALDYTDDGMVIARAVVPLL